MPGRGGHPAGLDLHGRTEMLRMLLGLLAVAPIIVLSAEAFEAFPAGLQVGRVNETVELACGASPGQRVRWKGDRPWVALRPRGPWDRSLRIAGLDVSSAGNYTCWAGPALLRSTFLAVQDPASPLFGRQGGNVEVSCEAESYDGSVTCSWRTLHPATFRGQVLRGGQASAACPSRDVAARPGPVRMSFRDCSFCPFAELQKGPLRLQVEGVGEIGNYENLTTEIFLPDIVRPAAPDHLVARRGRRRLTLSWTPPASWPLPSAYFALRYHLWLQTFREDVYKEVWSDKLQESSEEEEEEELVWRVKIRCRDPLLNSAWSAWSSWAPVTAGREPPRALASV